MNDQYINIVIAEESGWQISYDPPHYQGLHPKIHQPDDDPVGLPNYTTDLNAMHEAEKTLTYEQGGEMTLWIERMSCAGYGPQLFATARQRAEAFLRTIGKWEDKS